jgi:hypothetical protein
MLVGSALGDSCKQAAAAIAREPPLLPDGIPVLLRCRATGSGDVVNEMERHARAVLEGGASADDPRIPTLAGQAELVSAGALARFQDPAHLEPLALVQLCCERLRGLPQRIGERRPLLESGGGILLSAEDLELRLAREQEALRRERSGTLRRERQRLVDQLSRNLDAARFGMDAREARLLALATRLEQIEGGLRQLQQQVDQQWPSSEASGAAVAEAIAPLDEALDQIERLLDAGRDPQTP